MSTTPATMDTMSASPVDPTQATYIVTTQGSSGTTPYFRQDEDDPRYAICPTCAERVGHAEPKDFESFGNRSVQEHWLAHHASESTALMDRFTTAGLDARVVADRPLVPTHSCQPRRLITFATAEDHEDVMRVLNDHPTVIAIEGEPPGVLSGLLQTLGPLAGGRK